MSNEEKVDKLLRSMACIDAWVNDALRHGTTFGNDYRRALLCIQQEVQAAIKAEGCKK